MTNEEQLEEWLRGNSVHRKIESSVEIGGEDTVEGDEECCPDFSCCGGDLAELYLRERFIKAFREGDTATTGAMCGMFLGKMIEKHFGNKHDVYISDGTDSTEH